MLTLIFCAAFADVLSPLRPDEDGTGGRFLPPGGEFLLVPTNSAGTCFSRILHGSRITLLVGAVAVGISLTVGMLVGMVAAFRRGWVEAVLMRGHRRSVLVHRNADRASFVAVLGPSLQNAVIAVGVAGIPFYARTCYSAALVETSKPYFEASVAAGAGSRGLVFVHLSSECHADDDRCGEHLACRRRSSRRRGLSFLGLGAQPPITGMGLYAFGGP